MNSRKLRDPQGWNVGLLKALALPDGAFKLYVWLRLNGRIDTGSLETRQSDLSRALQKARSTKEVLAARKQRPHNFEHDPRS